MNLAKIIKKPGAAIALVLAMAGSLVAAPVSYATDVPEYRLQVSPTRDNIGELQPGETYEGSFKVQNTGQSAFKFTIDVAPYTVQGQNYDPEYSKSTEYTEIVDWVEVSTTNGEIEANGTSEISYKIQVPEDAPGGSQSAAILVSLDDNSANDGTGVQTIRQAAYLLYANIAGNTRSSAEILENKIPTILFSPPIVASSVVKNTGNIYTRAEYLIEVKSFFGGKVAYTNEDSVDAVTIFPDTERYNEVSWEGAPQIGLFKVKQTVKIFDEVSEVEKVVFLCPIWFLVLIIAIIGVAIFWIVSHILKRKQQ